ncbi:MAG: Hint domain-containing protein [Pseudomonadota bacterium]
MPTFNVPFYEFDPASVLGNVGSTYTFTANDFADQGLAVVTDTDGILSDDSGSPDEDATADVTFSDTSELNGVEVNVEDAWVLEYEDPGNPGQFISFQVGAFEVDDGTDYAIFAGTLPPVGVEVTVTARNTLPDPGEAEAINSADIVCFTSGTRILTAEGEIAVEELAEGDLVMTRDHGLQPVRWVGARTVAAEGALAPVVLKAGAMGNTRDLAVSPAHRMMLSDWRAEAMFGQAEVLVTAKQLLCRDDVHLREGGEVTYHHVLFDQHEIIFAEGAATESFQPSQAAISNLEAATRAEVLALFPELAEAKAGATVRPTLTELDAQALFA